MTQKVELLLSEEEIKNRVSALAIQMAPKLTPGTVVVALLKGASVFAADLVRELSRHGAILYLDFMVLSSYGHGTSSSGTVTVKMDCGDSLKDRDVLLLDDILDSGNTLAFAEKHLRLKGAKSLISCVLLDKPDRRQTDFKADFVGFTIPNLFVVGYGIDYAERFRELPFVGHIKE